MTLSSECKGNSGYTPNKPTRPARPRSPATLVNSPAMSCVVIQPRVVAIDLPNLDKIIKKLAYWLNRDLYAFGITFTHGQPVLDKLAITSELWLEGI